MKETTAKPAEALIRHRSQVPVQTRVVNGVYVVVLPDDSPAVDGAGIKLIPEDEF